MNKTYFRNLDGLRFMSFFLVFIGHAFQSVEYICKNEVWYEQIILKFFELGETGVSFFFVLSGFLITYLLISEKDKFGKINILNFYIRRCLRIWPLYYAVMVFGYFIVPMLKVKFNLLPDQLPNPYYCFTFLNNFDKLKICDVSAIISVFWSVAIEEQFYLIWPLLFYFFKPKYYLIPTLIVLIFSNIFRCFYFNIIDINIHTFGVITDMATGGMLAYFAYYNSNFISYVERLKKPVIIAVYLFLFFLVLFKNAVFEIQIMFVLKRLILSLLFCFVIAEQNYAINSFFKMKDFKIMTFLGKYTFGLYCLHSIAISIGKKILNFESTVEFFLKQIIVSFVLSVILSLISYHLFEKWFLNLKEKFIPK